MAPIFFVRRLLSLVYLMRNPMVPLRLKALPVVAAAYLIWPRDLWLDYLPLGLVDDVIIGLILISIFTAKAWKYVAAPNQHKEEVRKDSITVDFKVIDEGGQANKASKSRRE